MKKLEDFLRVKPDYKSKEELYFSWFLDELKDNGYISHYEYECKSYNLSFKATYTEEKQLKTKTKTVSKHLLAGHVYTPDFKIKWDFKAFEHFTKAYSLALPFWGNNQYQSIIEVKPVFDQNNMTRLFSINQKWMMAEHGIYVQKVIPQKLFKDTFTPKRYLITDGGGQARRIKWKKRSLEEFVS